MRIVIATRNTHKAQEIRAILSDRFEYQTLRDLPGAPEPIEDSDTFEGNAIKKASTLANWLLSHGKASQSFVLADDSGLEVDALHGAPGVHSARFAALDDPPAPAGKNSPNQANNAKLLRLLAKAPVEKRTARFRCVIALVALAPNPGSSIAELAKRARIFQGRCEGRIAFSPAGKGGFGYDPLFIPNGYDVSFAQLGEDIKNMISHRAKALGDLKAYLSPYR